MPSAVRNPRYAQFLQRIFNTKDARGELQVLDDVIPVVPMIDPTDPDQVHQRGEIPWHFGFAIAAGGAGTYAEVNVGTAANWLTTITGIYVYATAGSQVRFYVNPGAGVRTYSALMLDCRDRERTLFTGGVGYSTATPAVAPTAGACVYVNGYFPVGAVIDQDDSFILTLNNANQGFWGTVWGYDRPTDRGDPDTL